MHDRTLALMVKAVQKPIFEGPQCVTISSVSIGKRFLTVVGKAYMTISMYNFARERRRFKNPFRQLLVSITIVIMFAFPITGAAAPAFYHWYHSYDEPMSTCSDLVNEAADNIGADSSNVKKYKATVVLNGARGIVRCLSQGSQKSWVIIIAYADRRASAKELFDRIRLVVCGNCSGFVD